ncbi:hypothetical protein CBS101457_005515 [Exobasidium rhododendri]|nr:hypothetical protein CBS101457_005515 [Exobasidium rhododendri]
MASATTPIDVVALRKRYDAAGQGHVFRYWDDLSPESQGKYVLQLSNLNVERVNEVYKTAIEGEKDMQKLAGSQHKLEPPPERSTVSVQPGSSEESHYKSIGIKAISEGQVGVLLMAGGQGTRLGSSDPKGCFDIGLPSHKSLFQLQAERIGRLQMTAEQETGKSGVIITWFVMTSGPTRKPTEKFFREKKFFGLDEKNVIFFEQGTLPCLTMEGKVMLDSTSSIATAPDGNGGLYTALRQPLSSSGETILSLLSSRKIMYLHAYGVDNCLVRVGDPTFLGINIEQCEKDTTHQAGVKTVKKVEAKESVGVVALKDGLWNVIEYSEIPASLSSATDSSGQLLFRSANIVNHFYTTKFLATDVPSFEAKIPFHIARKKIPCIDMSTGKVEKPTSPNGMKMELFIFDVFPFIPELIVHEVERSTEFSPLKNASGTGVDDPQTSKRDLLNLQKSWLKKAGAEVAEGIEVEISPLVSYAGEGLEGLRGKRFTETTSIESL